MFLLGILSLRVWHGVGDTCVAGGLECLGLRVCGQMLREGVHPTCSDSLRTSRAPGHARLWGQELEGEELPFPQGRGQCTLRRAL